VLANFKLAFGQARQDQDFATALGAPPAGVSNLGGKIDTSLAQVGFSARPMPKLSVTGSYRYREDKDKTPIAPYGVVGPFTYTNYSIGRTVETARLDATYRFPARFMGTVRLDYEQIDRDTFTSTGFASGVSALRRETTETGVLVEARRSMTATLSGALSVRVSQRDGSRWLQPNSGTGVTPVSDPATQLPATAIFSPTLADRDRERVKFNTTWLAAEGLSLQLSAEAGKDDFDTPSPYAVRSIKSNLFSLDADYTLSDEWHLTGYVSRAQQKLDQARPGGYVGGFKDTGWNAGIGVRGQPLEKLQLGGGLSLMDNTGAYDQGLDIAPAPGSAQLLAATGGLPDITFRLTEVKLFGNYALSAASTVRLDAVYQRVRYDDWAYGFSGVPFLFGDNTTLSQKDRQNVVYFGISYAYTWR
jgi:MtrB/PioB family decaheme-associated outer membrane protein